eukprot:2393715-Prymnesium_polylepis.1
MQASARRGLGLAGPGCWEAPPPANPGLHARARLLGVQPPGSEVDPVACEVLERLQCVMLNGCKTEAIAYHL